MIIVKDLSKAYGDTQALNRVSFEIGTGEIVGLLGANGAGKSTMIKTLTGYLQPDSGSAEIGGVSVLANSQAVQAQIGYLPENAPLYPELTVFEYLQMMADLRAIPPNEQRMLLVDAIDATGLTNRVNQPIGELSKGFRQRVGIAQAILHRPKLLILDEPTVGLDPSQIIEIRHLIKRLAEHSTILFSTHILAEVEMLCDRALILINGALRLDVQLADLTQSADVQLVLDHPPDDVADKLRGLSGVQQISREKDSFFIQAEADVDLPPAIFNLAAVQGWQLRELRPHFQTLESIFSNMLQESDDVLLPNNP